MAKVQLKKEVSSNGVPPETEGSLSAAEKADKRRKIRLIAGLVLIGLVIAFSLISIINIRQRIVEADEVSEPLLWRGLQDTYIFCGALLIVALGIAFGVGIVSSGRPRALRIIGAVIWFAALAVSAEGIYAMTRTVIHSNQQEVAADARYLVVVGTPLTENRTTDELAARLDTASDWWETHQDSTMITTKATDAVLVETFDGGETTKQKAKVSTSLPGRKKSQGVTTNSVMKTHICEYLEAYFPKNAKGEQDIPETVLIQEDQSVNVRQAFEQLLAMDMIDENTPIVVVINGCQMGEAVRIAREAGFTDISRLPAGSSFWGYMSNIMWETWLENDPELSV